MVKAKQSNRFDVLGEFSALDQAIAGDRRLPIEAIPLDRIHPGSNYRLYFDEQEIDDLARIFRDKGFHGALWVEPHPKKEGHYSLISGERSWRAACRAGFTELPAEIIPNLSDRERAELGYLANEAPKRLNAIEDTLALLDLLSLNLGLADVDIPPLLYRLNNAVFRGLSDSDVIQIEQIDALFNRLTGGSLNWKSFTRNRLPLLRLPEAIKEAIHQGKLNGSVARVLQSLNNHDDQMDLMHQAIAENLSLREVQRRANALRPAPPSDPLVQRYRRIGDRLKSAPLDSKRAEQVIKLMERLERLLGDGA